MNCALLHDPRPRQSPPVTPQIVWVLLQCCLRALVTALQTSSRKRSKSSARRRSLDYATAVRPDSRVQQDSGGQWARRRGCRFSPTHSHGWHCGPATRCEATSGSKDDAAECMARRNAELPCLCHAAFYDTDRLRKMSLATSVESEQGTRRACMRR